MYTKQMRQNHRYSVQAFWMSFLIMTVELIGSSFLLAIFAVIAVDIGTRVFDSSLVQNYDLSGDWDAVLWMVYFYAVPICLIIQMYSNEKSVMKQIHQRVNHIVQTYHAKQIRNLSQYHQLMDVLDEVSTGLQLDSPIVYLIYDAQYSKVMNCLSIVNNDEVYLFITQKMLDDLSRYELEAVVAAELISSKSNYNNFLANHYDFFTPIRRIAMSYVGFSVETVVSSLWMLIIMIPVGLIYLMIYLLRLLFNVNYTKRINHHLQFINTEVVKFTHNPQVLVSAYQKVVDSNFNFDEIVDKNGKKIDFSGGCDAILWLNPLKTYRYRWSLADQLKVLKEF